MSPFCCLLCFFLCFASLNCNANPAWRTQLVHMHRATVRGDVAHRVNTVLRRPVAVHGGISQGNHPMRHLHNLEVGLETTFVVPSPFSLPYPLPTDPRQCTTSIRLLHALSVMNEKRYLSNRLYLSWQRVSMELLLGVWKGGLAIVTTFWAHAKFESDITTYAAISPFFLQGLRQANTRWYVCPAGSASLSGSTLLAQCSLHVVFASEAAQSAACLSLF